MAKLENLKEWVTPLGVENEHGVRHAVVEAVIVINLSKRLKSGQINYLKQNFQKNSAELEPFVSIPRDEATIRVQSRNSPETKPLKITSSYKESGLRLSLMNINGDLIKHIRIENVSKDSASISFHSLSYPGWNTFKREANDTFKSFANVIKNWNINVKSLGLSYIDAFDIKEEDEKANFANLFTTQSAISLHALNAKGNWIMRFANNHNATITNELSLQQEILDMFITRMLNQPTRLVMQHQSQYQLTNDMLFHDFLGSKEVIKDSISNIALEEAHSYNKHWLKAVFVSDVLRLIGIDSLDPII